jgi:hypothetical protein
MRVNGKTPNVNDRDIACPAFPVRELRADVLSRR